MVMSTISRHSGTGTRRPDGSAARAGPRAPLVGPELRRRRIAAGLSQAALGAPFTRAYVSAVERGRISPSLPALDHMVGRLGTTLGDFFAAVDRQGRASSAD